MCSEFYLSRHLDETAAQIAPLVVHSESPVCHNHVEDHYSDIDGEDCSDGTAEAFCAPIVSLPDYDRCGIFLIED